MSEAHRFRQQLPCPALGIHREWTVQQRLTSSDSSCSASRSRLWLASHKARARSRWPRKSRSYTGSARIIGLGTLSSRCGSYCIDPTPGSATRERKRCYIIWWKPALTYSEPQKLGDYL